MPFYQANYFISLISGWLNTLLEPASSEKPAAYLWIILRKIMLNAQIIEQHSDCEKRWFDTDSAKYSNEKMHKEPLQAALAQFQSHQLADLDKANLMDRVDVKFMLPRAFLPALLAQLQSYYSVLEINNQRISRYYNQYFDTKNLRFYHDHHNGKLNRFKVRQRTYLDTDTQFLEVKFKNNQKRTVKTRIPCNQTVNDEQAHKNFIHKTMGMSFDDLVMSQQGGYQRIALANEASAERLTLDFNLWYQGDENSEKLTLPGFFIAELKQHKRSKRSPFFQLMSKNNIVPASFSKYCIGCALLHSGNIKTNQFKAILGQIEKFSLANHSNIHPSN
ncbi:MAG: hypothetical protein ACJA13_001171 [Paraglaciecola sp.]